jgi:hypothetical protein
MLLNMCSESEKETAQELLGKMEAALQNQNALDALKQEINNAPIKEHRKTILKGLLTHSGACAEACEALEKDDYQTVIEIFTAQISDVFLSGYDIGEVNEDDEMSSETLPPKQESMSLPDNPEDVRKCEQIISDAKIFLSKQDN